MIAAHLAFDYGINVDFSDVSVKELEINRTFRLDNDFSEYHRVINLIMIQFAVISSKPDGTISR